MRVAKMITGKGKSRIVEVLKVSDAVRFAEGVWILVKDLDRDRISIEMRWVSQAEVSFDWVREFAS